MNSNKYRLEIGSRVIHKKTGKEGYPQVRGKIVNIRTVATVEVDGIYQMFDYSIENLELEGNL